MATHHGRTALYRLLDKRGEVIYVGVAATPEIRWRQHAATKAWWREVAERRVEWIETRPEAERIERRLIRELKPRYNLAPGGSISVLADYPIPAGVVSPELRSLILRYRRTARSLAKLRDDMELLAVDEMLEKGTSRSQMALVLPFAAGHVNAIADRAGVPVRPRRATAAD